MPKEKLTLKYHFTVEGETEQWYLYWLRDLINKIDDIDVKVSIDCPIYKDPLKRVKRMTVLKGTNIYHLSDYESAEEIHVTAFKKTMERMKEAEEYKDGIKYTFGYSNFTFDLWIILHKTACNSCYTHRHQYIDPLNKAYGTKFENLDQYKHEDNFKGLLSQLKLENVIEAVKRAKKLMKRNEENGYVLHEYKGFKYYEENAATMVWLPVEKILKDCKLIKNEKH